MLSRFYRAMLFYDGICYKSMSLRPSFQSSVRKSQTFIAVGLYHITSFLTISCYYNTPLYFIIGQISKI